MGAKKRRHKGSARAYERRKVFASSRASKTRRAAGSLYRLEAEFPERTLRGRLPVLHCRPLRASLPHDPASKGLSLLSVLAPYPVRRRWRLEPVRALAALLPCRWL